MDGPSSSSASSPALSPQLPAARPQHNCLECKRLKRRCDKGIPCGQCAKAGRSCEYRDPADDGLYGPISQAKDVDSLAFGTLLDVLVNKPRAKDAVSLYFSGIHTWFPIIEKANFERELDAAWGNLPAETSVLVLCMNLLARPPNQKSTKGINDTVYIAVKGTLSAVQSKAPLSITLLQSELLVAMYEFSQGMPQQAYLTVGRCLHMTKAFQWHEPNFWDMENQMCNPLEPKLWSILWWAIVYVDCLLKVSYQDQVCPMHTAGLPLLAGAPLPHAFDPYMGPLVSPLLSRDGDQIGHTVFPEAKSAWLLSAVLQHLANPVLSGQDPKYLTDQLWNHAKSTRAVGSAFIALMQLNWPGLLGEDDLMSMTKTIRLIQTVTNITSGKAAKLADSEDELNRGAIDPSWAFAMCYAAQLLILYGDGVLQDPAWPQKVAALKAALEKISKRWKIAERYCVTIQAEFDNRLSAAAASPFGGGGLVFRPAVSAASPVAMFSQPTMPMQASPSPQLQTGNSAYARRDRRRQS